MGLGGSWAKALPGRLGIGHVSIDVLGLLEREMINGAEHRSEQPSSPQTIVARFVSTWRLDTADFDRAGPRNRYPTALKA